MVRILLVDDHPSVMEGTKVMLEKHGDMQVFIESSAGQVLKLIGTESFDVMLFDLFMPDMNGLELARQVLDLRPESVVLIYTGFDIAPHFNRLIEAGVAGFVSKTSSQEQLVTSIRCALRKEAVLPLSVLKELRRGADTGETGARFAVTEREVRIIMEIAKGKSNKEIAEMFVMSQRSLEYVLTQLFQKLGVRSRIEAVAKSEQLGLLLTSYPIL